MTSKTYRLDCKAGGAALYEGDTCLREFVWTAGGGSHLMEVIGDGDRARRVEVMATETATAGRVGSDKEGWAMALKACPKGTVSDAARTAEILGY